jgi:hypothetical protein
VVEPACRRAYVVWLSGALCRDILAEWMFATMRDPIVRTLSDRFFQGAKRSNDHGVVGVDRRLAPEGKHSKYGSSWLLRHCPRAKHQPHPA